MKKTVRLEIRLTEEEHKVFVEKAAPYPSLSSFVRSAVSVFDDKLYAKKLKSFEDLCNLIMEHKTEMSRQGNNLNQIAHACNLLSKNNKLSESFIESEVLPVIRSVNGDFAQILFMEEKIFKNLFV